MRRIATFDEMADRADDAARASAIRPSSPRAGISSHRQPPERVRGQTRQPIIMPRESAGGDATKRRGRPQASLSDYKAL